MSALQFRINSIYSYNQELLKIGILNFKVKYTLGNMSR